MIVVVHLDLAVGNHTGRQHVATLSTLHFGDRSRALDLPAVRPSLEIEESRTESASNVGHGGINGSSEIEEKV